MDNLSVYEILIIIKKYLKYIIACVVGWTLLAVIIVFYFITPIYNSSAQILVSQLSEGGVIQGTDIDTNLRLINTYKDIIRSPLILDEVTEVLDTNYTQEQLSGKIEIRNQDTSQVLVLEVTDESPSQAALIANVVSETFQNKIGELMNIDNVTIISRATAESTPISPGRVTTILIAALIGLANGVGVTLILYALDNTIKDESVINEKLQWVCLGEIEKFSDRDYAPKEIEETTNKKLNPSAVRSRL